MSDPQPDAAQAELLADLAELVTLLRDVGEDHWAAWMESDRARIADGQPDGLTHLLSAYGGMGSFNDLVIHPANGHDLPANLASSTNDKLRSLRSHTWINATALTRA